MNIAITVGGALVGLLAATWVLLPWWRKSSGSSGHLGKGGGGGGRNWKHLTPFGTAFAFGTLCSLCAGGLLGNAAHRLGQGSNTIGDKILSVMTGANSPAVARHGLGMLHPGGAVALILLLIGLVIWWRGSGRTMRRDMALGILSGVTLGPTAGIAGIAAVVLAPAANTAGGWLVGLL